MECGALDHASHEKEKLSVGSAAILCKPMLHSLRAVAATQHQLDAAGDAVRQVQEQAMESLRACGEATTALVRRLRQAATTLETVLQTQLKATTDHKTAVLTQQRVDLEEASDHAKAGVAFVHAVMDVCNPAEQLVLKPLLVEGLSTICRHSVSLTPRCVSHVEVVGTSLFEELLASAAGALAVALDTAPHRCTAAEGLSRETPTGKNRKWLVTTYDIQGNKKHVGGDTVELVRQAFGGHAPGHVVTNEGAAAVTDHQDGTYTCTYQQTDGGGDASFAVKVNGAHIRGSPFGSHQIQIFFRNLQSHQTEVMLVNPSDTIGDLKSKIGRKFGVAASKKYQQLVWFHYEGKWLDPEKMISDYSNIQQDSTINLMIRSPQLMMVLVLFKALAKRPKEHRVLVPPDATVKGLVEALLTSVGDRHLRPARLEVTLDGDELGGNWVLSDHGIDHTTRALTVRVKPPTAHGDGQDGGGGAAG
jgi:hypothetical protein